MARRITQSDKAAEPIRVEEDGEWITLRPALKVGEFYDAAQGEQTQTEITRRLLAVMITDWSFEYVAAEGQPSEKLPITYQNIVDNEDALVMFAAAKAVNTSDFLARVSRLASRNNS